MSNWFTPWTQTWDEDPFPYFNPETHAGEKVHAMYTVTRPEAIVLLWLQADYLDYKRSDTIILRGARVLEGDPAVLDGMTTYQDFLPWMEQEGKRRHKANFALHIRHDYGLCGSYGLPDWCEYIDPEGLFRNTTMDDNDTLNLFVRDNCRVDTYPPEFWRYQAPDV